MIPRNILRPIFKFDSRLGVLCNIFSESYASKNENEEQTKLIEEITRNITDRKLVKFSNLVKELKQSILLKGTFINERNFDAVFLESCIKNRNYALGNKFFRFLYLENGLTNLAVIGKYFRMCFELNEFCDNNDKHLMIEIYNNVVKQYEFLDLKTTENITLGLSITSLWKEGLNLINMIKEFVTPSSKVVSQVAQAAFKNGDTISGWSIMVDMVNQGLKPSSELLNYIIGSSLNQNELLSYMEKYLISPSEEIIEIVLKNYKGSCITKISPRGVCSSCEDSLFPIHLSQEDFNDLRDNFLNPVLLGKDIFLKTKPAELENFLLFLRKTRGVDVVFDGLNVAYSMGRKIKNNDVRAKLLSDVVKHFRNHGMKVMIIGRKHMKKWSSNIMKYIYDNSELFFADDLSVDDPFVLYASMFNGIETKFVSRDLMRGHKFLLSNLELKNNFQKWQQKNQLILQHVDLDGSVRLKTHVQYLANCQKSSSGSWHLPIYGIPPPGVPPNIYLQQLQWICFHKCNI